MYIYHGFSILCFSFVQIKKSIHKMIFTMFSINLRILCFLHQGSLSRGVWLVLVCRWKENCLRFYGQHSHSVGCCQRYITMRSWKHILKLTICQTVSRTQEHAWNIQNGKVLWLFSWHTCLWNSHNSYCSSKN